MSFNRFSVTHGKGCFALRLIAHDSSDDHFSLLGRTLELKRQWYCMGWLASVHADWGY